MPDPEDDLSADDVYISLAEELRVEGVKIQRVEMADCELSVLFENSACVKIVCDVHAEFPVFRERSPAPA